MVAETLKVEVEADTQRAERNLSNVQGESKNTGRSFAAMATKIAIATAAFAAVANEMRKSLKAYSELESAQNRVAAAAEINGENLDDVIPKYNRLASEIQELTVVSDDAALEMIALAQQMGVTSGQMDEVVRGAVGISRSFGIGQQQAIRAVTNALEGNTDQLGRYIPAVRNASTEAEAIAATHEAMANSFAMAEAETDTLAGRQAQLSNAISDVRETIGEFLAGPAGSMIDWAISQAEAINTVIERMGVFLGLLDESEQRRLEIDLAAAQEQLRAAERSIHEIENASARAERALGDQRDTALALAKERREEARDTIQDLQDQIDALDKRESLERDISDAIDESNDSSDKALDFDRERERAAARIREIELDRMGDTERRIAMLQDEIDALAEVRNAMRDAGEETEPVQDLINILSEKQGDIDTTTSAIDTTTSSVYELGSAFSDSALNIDAANEAMSELQSVQAEKEAQDRDTRDEFESITESNIAAIQRQRDAFIDAGVDEVDAARWAATQIAQEYMSMAQQVGGAAMSLANTLVQAQDRSTQNQIANLRDEVSELEDRHEREIAFAKAAGASEEELADLKARQLEKRQEAEERADEKEAELKEKQFRREQALSIAQAVMNTAQAVTRALTAGPIAGPILAGTIGALGAAQVAAIASESPPAFERGGSFVTDGPQTIQVGDGQSPRERVTVEPLSGPYANGGGGGSINVTINGVIGSREQVADWINEGIRRGRERGKIRA